MVKYISKLEDDIINDLSAKSCISIKISYEDEGLDFIDSLFIKTYCDKKNIPIYLKIGGAESIRDIKDANKLEIKKIIAPMIESDFALEKYIKAAETYYTVDNSCLGINIESYQGYKNLDKILDSTYSQKLDSITIGRGDLADSLKYDRYNGGVNSDEMLNICVDILTKLKKHNKKTYIGGSMNQKSEKFCLSLIESNLLDNFETRNVIFKKESLQYYSFNDLINAAIKFEYEFLLTKQDYYLRLSNQDLTRINNLTKNIK